MEIAELIRRRRKELHMSQQQLADEVGVSRAAIGQWESGITGPTRKNAPKLAKALQLELSALSYFLAQPVSEVDTSTEGRHLSTSPDWPTITCNSHNPGNILAVVVGHWRAVRR
jgi:transcriptional regulator with XRE-family HTH domain